MNASQAQRDLVIGVSLCGQASARLCAAVSRAGGTGVLDLAAGDGPAGSGLSDGRLREALRLAGQWSPGPVGLRVGPGCELSVGEVAEALGGPDRIGVVLLGPDSPWQVAELAARHRVLAEVTDADQALTAVAAGAHGVVARGNEAGGRVGELSSFVLLQRLLGLDGLDLPIWVWGGIGPRTAAAAVLGGAAGVVLDAQLALLPEVEADLPGHLTAAVRASDGSDTEVVAGHRLLTPKRSGRGRAGTVPGLPVGQDAGLAKDFADRYGSVARCLSVIRAGIADAVDGDVGGVLAAGSALARSWGTRLPVAQGPMTRVSDRPEFAAAVAEHGGLPFVALALADGAQTRSLLGRTRAALGERPWGVGLLGFAPDDVRAAQLEAVEALRPPVAIIAGGRPAQAAALERHGIATYLHVPSPALLRQFVAAGARKFVFEGAECGGHVGPRASFPLWEAQVGVLLDLLDGTGAPGADEFQLLFAGGVHDARSAAMVSALALPLAQRGAGVGILMGTAYLFTEEAVHRGAVHTVFQDQVLAAGGTDLLETAPGHATRCVRTPFVRSFHTAKEQLLAAGTPAREVWEHLEQLNVGRLRLASKGLRREGAELVPVGDEELLAEGLFMAGQVACLRSRTTTVRALHDAVTAQAGSYAAARAAQLRDSHRLRPAEPTNPAAPLDVAIVGMACVFAQAPDLDTFWANVVGNVDAVTEVPADRWDQATYYRESTDGPDGRRTSSKWGGFLPQIPFDPLRFGIPPAALAAIEPVQLLALEVARRALADAGYAGGGFDRARTSVVFAAEAGSDLSNASVLRTLLPAYLGELPAELDQQLPKLTEDSFPGMLSNVIAGRIANRLDLGGANYTVDAACASSLAAVDAACKELAGGGSDVVLCGGADLHNGINDYLLFSSVGALSATGRCRPFDSAADGTTLGEGVACVVLKRLRDAERDGDRVYAVIKGVGAASDGKALGLTAPRPEGQRHALERAYAQAGLSPAQVGLLEAHGTGTVVGDRTELSTATAAFSAAGSRPGSCVLGSVKSQIGHTKCAAGMAGLIKSALALHTGIRPPTLHVDAPNPAWLPQTSPFAFHRSAAPWPQPATDRVAGVSAFGFGGTNFHVVLAGHATADLARQGVHQWPAELFTFRGSDHSGACGEIERVLELARANDAQARPWRLRDLARTAALPSDAGSHPVQVAVVARDLDELAALLARALRGEHDPACGLFLAAGTSGLGAPARLAVLFPGQGSQRAGMLAELFVAFPELQELLPPGPAGDRLAAAMFPPAALDPDQQSEQAARLQDTRVAQPALGVTGLAVHRLLGRLGVQAEMLAGHSYGELVALSAAGAFDPATLLELSAARAEAILASAGDEPGTMAAVAAEAPAVRKVLAAAGLDAEVVIANHNSPRQVVLSGATPAMAAAVDACRAAGLAATGLKVACAFHSPLVAAAGARFGEALATRPVRAPELAVWSNRTAARYLPDGAAVRDELAAQIGSPVRFAEQVEAMYAAGARVFFEAGPGRTLSRLVDAILADRPHLTVACEGPNGRGLRGFLAAAAQLAVAGVGLRSGWLFSGRDAVDVSNATPPPRPAWTVDGQLVRDAAGLPVRGGLVPARRIDRPLLEPTMTAAPADRDDLVREFLRTSRELVAAQRDVLLSLLGTSPAAPAAAPVPPALPPREAPALVPAAVPAAVPAGGHPGGPGPIPAQASPAARKAVEQPGPAAGVPDVARTVLAVICERTGYPTELIEPDLDLEADLGIDSIKRTEIAGQLTLRLAGAGLSEDGLDALVRCRTAGSLTEEIRSRLRTGGTTAPPAAETPSPAAEIPAGELQAVAPVRFVVGTAPVPDDQPAGAGQRRAETVLAGRRLLVVGKGPLTDDVSALLAVPAATVVRIEEWDQLGGHHGPFDAVLHLEALARGSAGAAPEWLPVLQQIMAHAPRWLLTVVPPADAGAGGLRGLFRSVAREYPECAVRLVEVDPGSTWVTTARALVDELVASTADPGVEPVLALGPAGRRRPTMVEAPLGPLARVGAGPAGDGASEARALGLDRDSVVLLLGGARGITAQVAGTLAQAAGCHLVLAGRTPAPTGPEDPRTVPARDGVALRSVLARLGTRSVAETESAARLILAQREVRATLEEVRRLGGVARYHSLDVRDSHALTGLVRDVHAEHGRIDGVVYAAGVIEDRFLADKSEASFRRVFDTKVDGARALLGALRELPAGPQFVVLFGSLAAVLGNRGQTDYAAANDALESLGAQWATATGRRALTVHWGPWAPAADHTGMVSLELARSYTGRGVALIDPAEGAATLLRELAWGAPGLRSVVYTASGW